MNMRKQKLARRRTNQRIQSIDNAAALDNHHPTAHALSRALLAVSKSMAASGVMDGLFSLV